MRALRYSLPMELMKAREAAMARFRPMLREHGLTETQWRVIRVLTETQNLTASDLASKSFLLRPSLTRILRHLESQSLIRRKQNNRDNRRAVVALTTKGRRLAEKVAPRTESLYAEIEQRFGPHKLDQLYVLLSDFHDALQEDR